MLGNTGGAADCGDCMPSVHKLSVDGALKVSTWASTSHTGLKTPAGYALRHEATSIMTLLTWVTVFECGRSLHSPRAQVCVTFIPTPSFILLLQLTTSAVAVWALSSAGIVSTEKMEMAKAKKYMLVVACFAGFLYCNVKALQVRRCQRADSSRR